MSSKRQYTGFHLETAAPQQPEELTKQAQLRSAVQSAVSETDVKEVVAGIVKRAKSGNESAINALFKFVLGGTQPVTYIQNNFTGNPDEPTEAVPGSPDKVETLRRRAAAGGELFNGQDNKRCVR